MIPAPTHIIFLLPVFPVLVLMKFCPWIYIQQHRVYLLNFHTKEGRLPTWDKNWEPWSISYRPPLLAGTTLPSSPWIVCLFSFQPSQPLPGPSLLWLTAPARSHLPAAQSLALQLWEHLPMSSPLSGGFLTSEPRPQPLVSSQFHGTHFGALEWGSNSVATDSNVKKYFLGTTSIQPPSRDPDFALHL